MTKPITMITGVGEGTGAAIARRFSESGYRVAMLARGKSRLEALERELDGAVAFPCDVSDLDALVRACEAVKQTMGPPSVFVHNAVRATFERFDEGDPEELERNFRVNTTALLYLARAVVPDMLTRGEGAIMVTGNTAAFRGVPSYALFSPTKAAQRNLAQALARDLGPKGIHVAYFNIDAVINVPWTRDRFHPEKADGFFIEPADIAGEVLHVAQQPRSAWSFDVEIRPFGERW
ncbi:SDR family NAD(P)-dependent oxidoreductase [Leisingera sp.]|uniref:SDR family NAD(P)-dependent oxidoreductase n=1 Tax=Leisingera sp. TaxID=1879318 RepID=UPI002B279ED5|nr:SDR family NAD(P)-dependent oxidoreductase [Leisingera sp.]